MNGAFPGNYGRSRRPRIIDSRRGSPFLRSTDVHSTFSKRCFIQGNLCSVCRVERAPSGTVTFLFTDIEGSTHLWDTFGEEMRLALARHDTIIRSAIEDNATYVFSTGGDGFAAVFERSGNALMAAVESQKALQDEEWPGAALIRVRMGLHTGEVEERDGDYFGPAVNRAARIMSAGHGGQILVSAVTVDVSGGQGFVDLGEYAFPGLVDRERVFQFGPDKFPALRSSGAIPSNLPADRSIFIGRQRELATVAGLTRAARIVTLTGVGGVGKTRLATQAAAGMIEEFPGGVWLVELAPLIEADQIASATASALDLPISLGADPVEVVCRFLAHRRALVVLDNCEHLIDGVATFVERILSSSRSAVVLATSREPLNLSGESVWRVPSLSIDVDGAGLGDAVDLFMERASKVRPGLVHSDSTDAAALAVCRRLDGIPLAIELAAARAGTMSIEQIALRLDERFRLLTKGGRTAVARHQTLLGAIDWSYALLDADERATFDVLGVFVGNFEMQAVASVCGEDEFDALDLVSKLADKSMLEADPLTDRYRLLETLRQYAWDRLVSSGRLAEALDAHAAYYCDLARRQAALMVVADRQVEALDRLEADYDNLCSCLAYLIEERRSENAARMISRMIGLFNIRHPREGLAWFRRVVAIAADLPPKMHARVLGDAASAAMSSGDLESQRAYAEASISVGGDNAPPVAYWLLAHLNLRIVDYEGAAELARQGMTVAAAIHDTTNQINSMAALVVALSALGDEAETLRLIPEVIALTESLRNPTISAAAYQVVGDALSFLDRSVEAIQMFDKALGFADTAGAIGIVNPRVSYSLVLDDAKQAAEVLRVAILVARDQLSGTIQVRSLIGAAKIATHWHRELLAAQLLGAYRN